jgi:macrodomain Ter protein organizer (MatP/YcbG family)
MAKKELNFGKLGLPTKTTIVKKEEEKEPIIEKAIEKIHGEPLAKAKNEPVKEEENIKLPKAIASSGAAKKTEQVIDIEEIMPVKKISMDLPLDVYKYLKMNAFDQAITMKDYVLRLIEADMKKKGR